MVWIDVSHEYSHIVMESSLGRLEMRHGGSIVVRR